MELSRRAAIASLFATTFLTAIGSRAMQAQATAANDDLTLLSIQEAGARLKAGTLTSVALVQAYLDRIAAIDGQLRSFIYVAEKEALAAAAKADAEFAAGNYRGPMHGIPFGIKDLYFTGDIPTSGNSRIDFGDLTKGTSTVVARLLDAGAILLGKMDTSEFATGSVKLYGDLPHPLAANPWNLAYYAGGSSTGPGAGVGGRTTLLAIGGDTGGSIRLPAASCGVQGLKPTYGRVSNAGALANTWSRDCTGPLAWHVADLGIALEAFNGYDPLDATTQQVPRYTFDPAVPQSLAGRRVAVVDLDGPDYKELMPEMRAGIERTIEILRAKGAEIVQIEFPRKLSEYSAISGMIGIVEFNAENYDVIMMDPSKAARGTLDRLPSALNYTAIEYARAKRLALEMTAEFEVLMADYDVLVLPGTFYTAGRFAEPEEIDRFMRKNSMLIASMTGHPALNMRSGFSSEGLPLNVQLIASHFDEASLIRYGMLLEPELDGTGPRPLPASLEELVKKAG